MSTMKFEWEKINHLNGDNVLYEINRAKVIGGWIVRSLSLFGDEDSDSEFWQNSSESMVFIPDPKHEWVIEHE